MRCQQRLQTLQVLQAAGQGDVGRAVDASDFDIGTGAQSGDGFFSRRGRHTDGSHAPLATGQVLRLATGADDGNGLLQTQGPTGPGSSNLANAVTQDRSGLHALFLEQPGNGHLHGKQQRLGHSSVLQAGMCGIDLQLLQQGKTGLGLHGGVQLLHEGSEARAGLQQGLPHANPLGTITCINKSNAAAGGQGFFLHQPRQGADFLALGKALQRLYGLRHIGRCQQQAMGQVFPLEQRCIGNVVIALRLGLEQLRITLGQSTQSRLRTRGQPQRRQH